MKENWIKTIFFYASQCKGKIALSVICACISVAAGLVPYLCVYRIITLFITGTAVWESVIMCCLAAVLAYAARFLFYGISTTLSHVSAYTILENIRLGIAGKLMKVPLGTVIGDSVGRLKSIMVDRVETIELPLAHMIPECISNLLMPAAVFLYMISIDWRMALAMMIPLPAAGAAFMILMKNFNQQYADYMTASNYVNSVIVEYIEGIETIKAFNHSTSSYEKYSNAVQSFKEYTLKWYRSSWKVMNFISAVLPSTLLGTLPVGMLLYKVGTLSPQDLVICLILSLGVVGPLMNFTTYINEAKTVQYAVSEVSRLMTAEELAEPESVPEIKNHDIMLRNVSFAYEAGAENVLDGIDLLARSGKTTALVGPSGSGKTTIARLAARFWDVSGGEIRIGGTNIRNIPLSMLSDMVSFVTQETFLFHCSIKENIRLGNPEASDEMVFAAAKAACCDEFIRKLENGYDTQAGDAGNRLSGGEKQRISIARMILKNAPIVILDEATAFTDPENEEKIQQSINALSDGKTLLVIAHRLSTIRNADSIVVINDGHVDSEGTHEELLTRGGLYKTMWEAHIGARNWFTASADRREA